jgi:hypothetical protein
VSVRSLALGLLGAAFLARASIASAEPPEHALAHPERTHRLWLRGVGSMGKVEGQQVMMAAPRFGGAFLLADTVDLDVEMPLVFANVDAKGSGETETRVAPGNPYVSASYVAAARAHRLSIGLGATAPVAKDDPDDAYDDIALAYARAARARREAWLYMPDRMAVVLSGSFESKIEHGPLIGVDAALALMPRVRGDASALEGSSQFGLSVAAVVSESVQLGGRFDSVLLPSDMSERVQNALVPFLHVSSPDGLLFAAELTINLDNPYGLSFTDGGVWGLSLLAGSRF